MNSELIVEENPKSTVSEDFRTIRTNLEFSLVDKAKTIMITSSVPGEGKSFVSSNLATVLAQNNKKVLLLDCDMRLGRIHKIFNLSNKKGLSSLIVELKDDVAYEEFIQKTNIKNLFVLTRGVVPPNPSELLASPRFAKLINDLRGIFDHIILDSVPVNGLSDALIITRSADKVIVVSRYGKTDIEDLQITKKALENVNAKVAGVVFNGVPKSRSKYGNYYTQ